MYHDLSTVLRSPGGGGKKVEKKNCTIHVAAEDLLKAVTERSKEKIKVTMDALSAEARRIEEEIEEFSLRTARNVASLLTTMSDIEDESANITKKKKFIEEQIESLLNEKKTFELLLRENKEKLEKLQAKKDEMDQMTDSKIRRFEFFNLQCGAIGPKIKKFKIPAHTFCRSTRWTRLPSFMTNGPVDSQIFVDL